MTDESTSLQSFGNGRIADNSDYAPLPAALSTGGWLASLHLLSLCIHPFLLESLHFVLVDLSVAEDRVREADDESRLIGHEEVGQRNPRDGH